MKFSNRIIGKIDQGFFILYLILSSNAFISLLTSDLDDPLASRESPLLVNMLLGVYGYFILRIFSLGKVFLQTLAKSKIVLVLVLYILVSAFISQSFSFSLQKAIAFTLTCITAAIVSNVISHKQFVGSILVSIVITIFMSAFFGLFLGNYGIHNDDFHGGSWRGVFPQKQVLGQYCLFAVVFLIVFQEQISRGVFLSLIVVSLLLLVLSASRTAWIVCALILAVNSYIGMQKRFEHSIRAVGAFLIICAVSIGIYYVYLHFAEVLDLLGKDETLTGRSTLWEYTLEVGAQNKWLGVGYKSFWPVEAELMFIYFGYYAVNGHNFILDTYLELGVFGVLVTALFFYSYIFRSFKCPNETLSRFSILMFLYVLLVGQVGTIFPNQNSLITFVVILLYFYGVKGEQSTDKTTDPR